MHLVQADSADFLLRKRFLLCLSAIGRPSEMKTRTGHTHTHTRTCPFCFENASMVTVSCFATAAWQTVQNRHRLQPSNNTWKWPQGFMDWMCLCVLTCVCMGTPGAHAAEPSSTLSRGLRLAFRNSGRLWSDQSEGTSNLLCFSG